MTQLEICTAIKAARKSKGINLVELAEMAGINKSTISEFENGKHNLSLANVLKITDALGLEVRVVSED